MTQEYEDEPPSGLKDLIDCLWYVDDRGAIVEPVVVWEVEVQDEQALVVECDTLFRCKLYGSQKKPCLVMKGYLQQRDLRTLVQERSVERNRLG